MCVCICGCACLYACVHVFLSVYVCLCVCLCVPLIYTVICKIMLSQKNNRVVAIRALEHLVETSHDTHQSLTALR